MSKTTRRKMGVSAFVALAVLGTGWVVERASSNAQMGGAVISESVSASEAAIVPVFQPPVTNSSEQYDRSDLLLSQG